jgi:hypothetical protein
MMPPKTPQSNAINGGSPPAQATDVAAPTDATATSTTKPKVQTAKAAKDRLLASSSLSSSPPTDKPVKPPTDKPVKPSRRAKAAAAGAATKAKEFADFHNSALNDSEPRRKPNGKTPPPAKDASPPANYDDDPFYLERIAKAREIGASMERSWWALCELADEIVSKYGYGEQGSTVLGFAADIDVPAIKDCTLLRRYSVYLAWRDIFRDWAKEDEKAPGPFSFHYAVLRALQGLDDRLELLRANPKMSKARAEELRRSRKNADEDDDQDEDEHEEDADDEEGTEDEEENADDEEDAGSDQDDDASNNAKKGKANKRKKKNKDWRQKEDWKYFKDLLIAANEGEDVWASYPEDPSVVRKHATTKSLPPVKACAEAWSNLYERMKLDLCGEEAAAEGDERLSDIVACARESNGSDKDAAQSAEDRKALYSDESALSDATKAAA